MPKLKIVSAKKLLKWLKKMGMQEVRQKGSHLFLQSSCGNYSTVLPMHATDIPRGTIRAILSDLNIEVTQYQSEI